MTLKFFTRSSSRDNSEATEIVDLMLLTLKELSENTIPNESYSMHDLEKYLRSLVLGQEKNHESKTFGCWPVIDTNERAPADFRVDFFYKPTYIASATLSICLLEHPLTTILMPGYLDALVDGLNFCCGRNLKGHGYEADIGSAEAIKILSLGKVPLLLHQNPDYSLKLKSVIEKTITEIKDKLDSGQTFSCWGENQTKAFESAIKAFEKSLHN